MLELLMGLATWRFSYMLQHEDGPGDIFVRFRCLLFDGSNIDGRPKVSFLSPTVKCFYCLSVWVALPFSIYLSRSDWWLLPIYALGLSAIAILFNLIHGRLE